VDEVEPGLPCPVDEEGGALRRRDRGLDRSARAFGSGGGRRLVAASKGEESREDDKAGAAASGR
jgi:hypothetical protein